MIKEQGNFVREYSEGHGYGRSDYGRGDNTRGRATAGLTLGIIGTALGAVALWNRNGGGLSSLLGGGSIGGGGSVPANVNINGFGGFGASGCAAPTPFEVYSKNCGDVLALTKGFYDQRITSLNEATAAREVDVAEKFSLYKGQVDADFGLYVNTRDNIDKVNNRLNDELFSLYKYTRDKDDAINERLCKLEKEAAVNTAVRPYQDRLLQTEIATAFANAINYVDKKTCKMITGVTVVPSTPTITGFGSYCCGSQPAAAAG